MHSIYMTNLLFCLTAGCVLSVAAVIITPPSYVDAKYKVVEELHGYQSITSIPGGMNQDATFINLKANALAGLLPDYAFSNFTNLLLLDLTNNDFVNISDKAFTGTPIEYLTINNNEIGGDFPDLCALNATLMAVDSSYNDLVRVPDERLSCLQKLLLLNAKSNWLQQMPDVRVLPNAHDFHTFWINGNDFNISTPLPFENLTGLSHVSMDALRLTTFPDLSALPDPNSFDTIRLAQNPITDVTPQALAGLAATRLKNLYISETGDILFQLAPSLSYLKNLICYYVDTIDSMAFPYLPDVNYVSMRYTTLTSLPDLLPLNLTLTTFILQDSPQFGPDPAAFTSMFAQLPLIKTLKLTGNNLTTLPNLTQLLPALTVLELDRNPWHCDCRIAWMMPDPNGFSPVTDFLSLDCMTPSSMFIVPLSQIPPSSLGSCPEG